MQKRSFGKTKDGKEVFLFSMENKNGVKAEVTNFGAILVNLFVPDKNGNVEDVVLGFDDVSGYEINPSYFGAVIAPNANRIGGASFTLNGEVYTLKKNNGENNLHSDDEAGAHKRIWDVTELEDGVMFTLKFADGELGFPGNKEFRVTYSLDDENGLKIHYEANSDKDTMINPTNHSYFNLNGHQNGVIEDHRITILASHYTPADQTSIPYGNIEVVAGTPMDLREEQLIEGRIDTCFEQLNFAGGFDHNWVTDDYNGEIRKIAVVKSGKEERVMEVYTDLPGVQFYAGNFIDIQSGKKGVMYGKRNGLCLETQYYPDSVHHSNFPSVIFGPGKEYKSTTIYKFV